MSLTQVPHEVLWHAFSYLPIGELVIVARVSKGFGLCVDIDPTIIPMNLAYVSLPRIAWGLQNGLEMKKIKPDDVIKIGNLEVFQLLARVVPWKLTSTMAYQAECRCQYHIIEALPWSSSPRVFRFIRGMNWRQNSHLEVLRAVGVSVLYGEK